MFDKKTIEIPVSKQSFDNLEQVLKDKKLSELYEFRERKEFYTVRFFYYDTWSFSKKMAMHPFSGADLLLKKKISGEKHYLVIEAKMSLGIRIIRFIAPFASLLLFLFFFGLEIKFKPETLFFKYVYPVMPLLAFFFIHVLFYTETSRFEALFKRAIRLEEIHRKPVHPP